MKEFDDMNDSNSMYVDENVSIAGLCNERTSFTS